MLQENWSRKDRIQALQFLERLFKFYLAQGNRDITPFDAWSQLNATDSRGASVAYSALRRSIVPLNTLADWSELQNDQRSKLKLIVEAQNTLTQN